MVSWMIGGASGLVKPIGSLGTWLDLLQLWISRSVEQKPNVCIYYVESPTELTLQSRSNVRMSAHTSICPLKVFLYLRHRGRATADFTESESEAGIVIRRRRRRNRSTDTLTYAADGCWDGSQSTLCRCTRHAVGSVL